MIEFIIAGDTKDVNWDFNLFFLIDFGIKSKKGLNGVIEKEVF